MLTHEFWDSFETAAFSGIELFGKKSSDRYLGAPFADIRGVVIAADDPGPKQAVAYENAHRIALTTPDRMRIRNNIGSPIDFLRKENNLASALSIIGVDYDGAVADHSWKMLRRESNLVLCEMQKGLAIYGSPMSSIYRQSDGKPPIVPYFIIYAGVSRDQIGRIVRRIHVLDELRLAALFDRKEILNQSQSIRNLGNRITSILHDFGSSDRGIVEMRELRSIILEYARIGSSVGAGGLIYRVSRSAYYVGALRERFSDLSAQPLTGWQSYERFVNRHYDQAFRSIANIGERYKNIGERIDRIVSLYQTDRGFSLAGMALMVALTALGASVLSAIFALLNVLKANVSRDVAGIIVLCVSIALIIIYTIADKRIRR